MTHKLSGPRNDRLNNAVLTRVCQPVYSIYIMGWSAIEAVDDIFRVILQNTLAPIDRKCDNSPMFYD